MSYLRIFFRKFHYDISKVKDLITVTSPNIVSSGRELLLLLLGCLFHAMTNGHSNITIGAGGSLGLFWKLILSWQFVGPSN